MAGPPKVEMEGQKKQRIRMRGTKQANQSTAKKIRKQLDQLLENPRVALPEMRFKGRLRWGRKDPVTKSIERIEGVIKNKDNVKWLNKAMVAKRGDPLTKAFAGSLRAAHDEDISLVGNFSSSSFGSASFIRRGDGKQGYMAGIQNFNHLTLRLFPWEDHARRGMFFFSWDGGFVCTGPRAIVPEGWIEDVLKRSRFSFESTQINGTDIFTTKGLDAQAIEKGTASGEGYVLLSFTNGPKVAIELTEFEENKKKENSFIHHLALSMLPPRLSSILTISANWYPQGWDKEQPLPERCNEHRALVLNAWQGLTHQEVNLAQSLRNAVLNSIDHGVLFGSTWCDQDDEKGIRAACATMHGSSDEQELAFEVLLDALHHPHEDTEKLFIDNKGNTIYQEHGTLRLREDAHCNDLLTALWEHHGQAGLRAIGLSDVEVDEIWSEQLENAKPFGKFLKELEKNRELSKKYRKFPRHEDQGCASQIEHYVIEGLIQGLGPTERTATKRHKSFDDAACAWAWLVAAQRSTGQEWHFENDARDRGGVWSIPTIELLSIGQQLLNEKSDDLSSLQEQWNAAFDALKQTTG